MLYNPNKGKESLVLFLDDDTHRTETFVAKVETPQLKVRAAVDALSAIHYLRTEKFSQIFLDHDLGGQIYVDSETPNSGGQVVRWMSENRDRIDAETPIILHTMNPVGATYMYMVLKDAGFQNVRPIPFTALLQVIK